MLREGVRNNRIEGSLMYMYFPSFSLENKLFGIHQTSFCLFRHLSFRAENTFGVYFFPSDICARQIVWVVRVCYKIGNRDRGGGGQNVPNARRGGNSPRKLPLENLDF